MSMRPARKIMKPPHRDDDSPDPIAMKGGKKSQQTTSRNIKVPARLLTGSEPPNSPKGRGASLPVRRKRPAPVEADSDIETEELDSPATMTSANHNKYCHFCQHVKVRASSMLACENQECCRRFCEHCLLTHLGEDVDPDSSAAWSIRDGKPIWHCPICRKRCCCSAGSCEVQHRHCKAYRYRRRRAELASKRMSASLASTEKRVRKAGSAAGPAAGGGGGGVAKLPTVKGPGSGGGGGGGGGGAGGVAGALGRSGVTFGYVRAAGGGKEAEARGGAGVGVGSGGRPKREAAMRRRGRFGEEEEEEEEVMEMEDDGRELEERGRGGAGRGRDEALGGALWMEGRRGGMAEGMMSEDNDEEQAAMDDVLGGIYGHMGIMGEDPDDELALVEDGLGASVDMDEALWLRKTYETVYNPVARQHALSALAPDAAGGERKGGGGRDNDEGMRCLGALAGGRALLGQEDRGILDMYGGDEDLSFFMSSGRKPVPKPGPGNLKLDGGKGGAAGGEGAARKCTVMYDFL